MGGASSQGLVLERWEKLEREGLALEAGPALHNEWTAGKHPSVPEPCDHSPVKAPPLPVPPCRGSRGLAMKCLRLTPKHPFSLSRGTKVWQPFLTRLSSQTTPGLQGYGLQQPHSWFQGGEDPSRVGGWTGWCVCVHVYVCMCMCVPSCQHSPTLCIPVCVQCTPTSCALDPQGC